MFIAFSKLLPLLFLPLGFSVILLLVATVRRSWTLVVFAAGLLWIAGTPAIANRVMSSLEDYYPYRTVKDCPKSDALFVFGGMLGRRDHPADGIAWNEAAERFERALRLFQAGRVQTIVLSGGAGRFGDLPDEGNYLKLEAIARGVPAEAILVTHGASDTREEAGYFCALVQEKRWKRVILVTSAFHMRRAMYMSRHCTAERIAVPVAYLTPYREAVLPTRMDYYFPSSQSLAVSGIAVHELLGLSFYWLS